MGSLPKSNKKNLPRSVNEMSTEMLRETLKKKKECNAKALEVVEKLCETSIDENWMLDNLQFINQCHFDDVTIERSISRLCGYPLCDQELKNVPTQQYHISTRYNKVFDITERKNFCSSCCYKSAMHIKTQLFTSPLWFRDQEVIPKYTILKSSKSSMGEEVVFFPDKIQVETENNSKASVSKKAETIENEIRDLQDKCSKLKICNSENDSPMTETSEGNKNEDVCKENTEASEGNKNEIVCKENVSSSNEIVKNLEEKKEYDRIKIIKKNIKFEDDCNKDEVKRAPILEKPKENRVKIKKKDEPLDPVQKVEKSVFEWFSLDTLFYLYGEEKLKELCSDRVDEIKQTLNSKLSMAGVRDKIDRMIQLYGLLDSDALISREIKTNLKPLPDYEALKEERNTVEIKVRAFYQGNLEVKQPPAEEKKKEKEETSNDNETIFLPYVDTHAQIPLRRKILLDKLNKVLPDLILILSSEFILQMNEVRNLVTTFVLAAHNITFKPSEWHLVGIIIIKLLSLKNKQLQSVMESESTKSQLLLILENYKLQKDYLENLILRLTDSQNLIKKINEMNR